MSEREAIKQARKLAQDAEEDDIRWLMNQKRGRRIMRRILDSAGVFQLSFRSDPLQMAFQEGRRNEGLRLLAIINAHSIEKYTLMLQEREYDGRDN